MTNYYIVKSSWILSKMKFILITLIFIACACNNQKNIKSRVIQEQEVGDTLSGKKRFIGVKILMPVRALIIKDKLVIYDRYKIDLFKIFNIPNLEFLYSQGKIGNGPDEFGFIPDGSVKEYKEHLVLIDRFRFKELLVEDLKFKTVKSFPIKIDVNGVDNFNLLDDSTYICDNKSLDSDNELMMINLNNKKLIKYFGDYPKFSKQITKKEDKYMCGLKTITSRVTDGRIAIFYIYLNKMKILDRAGNLLSETNIGNEELLSQVPSESTKVYRPGICSNSDFIYVLNVNAPTVNYFNNNSKIKPRVEIWNWDGELLNCFILNKAILSFAVSEKYHKIYATTLDTVNEIYEFKLP